MDKCTFCGIISGKLPGNIVYKDDLATAFYDIHPAAPTHILIVPNKHIPSVNDLVPQDEALIGNLFTIARQLAESEAEFSESLAFIREINFAGGHVFTYSAREGTPAARLPGQVPHHLRKTRNAQVREVFEASSREYRAGFVGSSLPVLWESAAGLGPDGWQTSGLTDNYLRVFAHTPKDVWNQITNVKLIRLNERGIVGEIL